MVVVVVVIRGVWLGSETDDASLHFFNRGVLSR